ncbi:hypothetical protein Nham_0324 [Nitrobacter hamburgensis X14]|uniref:Uncharacterized protein n=1 Tax=Nitrobacter hamburgensis (strain DSM 10229 / NCIMB 13809 / X14) TaxID=323097 RepID=Q1QRC7_NITHX|nr:hypothetical protein [Nitrobacter hamburgensis]ABE61220.1 hypothetical protein Nham_0324 [Nitrobacter hamburgensis X14]
MSEPKDFVSLQHFLFETPIYTPLKLQPGHFPRGDNLRGYCPHCKDESIFKVRFGNTPSIPSNEVMAEFQCKCVQNESHVLRFNLRIYRDTVEKCGQFPSYATIEQGSIKGLRKLIPGEDGAELARAIGLASHGVGIGSFVYVRRIFERVIKRKFEELRDSENWPVDALDGKRLDERIQLMKDHLPDFLVRNQKLYGILSLGIHELNEQDCLDFFTIAYSSIKFILDEDRRKREEKAERAEAERAIAGYKPPISEAQAS